MRKFLIAIVAILFIAVTHNALADDGDPYQDSISVFKSAHELEYFFKNSYGYAVFLTVWKAGYIIGGSTGDGQVYRKGEVIGLTRLYGGSIGFQIGGEAFSEIIFFQDEQAYSAFTSGNFAFDANAEAVALTAGAQASAGTGGTNAGLTAGQNDEVQAETDYINGMATFVHAKGGLMVDASVAGQKFTFERLSAW